MKIVRKLKDHELRLKELVKAKIVSKEDINYIKHIWKKIDDENSNESSDFRNQLKRLVLDRERWRVDDEE